MKQASSLLVLVVLAVLALVIRPEAVVGAEHQRMIGPAKPMQQLQTAPRRIPGQSLQVAPDRSGVVLRTHCNGTCMCTGSDCTEDWRKVCQDGPTCSSDPGGANLVCTCVKKVAD
jgi:hypothetical protein